MHLVLNIAALLGVALAMIPLRAAQRARFRSFEDMYVQRYWTLLDRMSPSCDPPVGDPALPVSRRDRKVLHAYLRLTEDQLDMRKVGWVTDETWWLWVDGMSGSLQHEPLASVWRQVKSEHRGFREIRRFEAHGFSPRYDPNQSGFCRRWLRGLAGLKL